MIEGEPDVTRAVLAELERASDPRLREVLSAFVQHLHDFAREVRLTEDEFRLAIATLVEIGQRSSPSHNEAMLMSGSLGLSQLIVMINNTPQASGHGHAHAGTDASILGPFWRNDSPKTPSGGSIVRSPTPGPSLFVTCRYIQANGAPIEGAEVDVWHSSAEGLYENQDPAQAEMNLRGRFLTDSRGEFHFRSIMPSGYPIPVNGPVGTLLRALGRHNMRPAHLHFLARRDGFKTLASQVYRQDDEFLDNDVQFGVTRRLVGDFVRHEPGETAPSPNVEGLWYSLDYTFVMEPGVNSLPKPPILKKAEGPQPVVEVLTERH